MHRLRKSVSRISRSSPSATFRSLYFNRIWIYGASIVSLIGVLAQVTSLALLGALVLASAGIAKLWNQATLSNVSLERALSADRALPGDIVTLRITVTNRKPLPAPSIRIEEDLSEPIVPVGHRSTIDGTSGRRVLHLTGSLRPYERITWTVPLECRARGSHWVGPATLRSGDPFGFFSSREDDNQSLELLVYPKVHPLPELVLPNQQPMGERTVSRNLVTDPMRISGIRDYRPEDPFRSIHWKATARHSTIQVKLEEPVTTLSMMILLNLDTFDHFWEGLDMVSAEQSIETAASIAVWGLEHRYAVGLRANGVVARSDQSLRIPVGRGPAQLATLMSGFARLWAYSTLPFGQTMASEIPRIPWGSTVVVVTPMMSSEIESQLAALIARGRRTVLVPLGEALAPDLPGLIVPQVTPSNSIAQPATEAA
jgi:uncharacterized protein (DUF58 family)